MGRRKEYQTFDKIDGIHPFKERVPDGFVDYEARQRAGGKVIYFNFELAKEMGLISQDHKRIMNASLEEKILETFSLLIINEYDIKNKTPIAKKRKKENRYMATRYLQLQHPNKKGKTSGDGRSIWNGYIKDPSGCAWDIMSCGTGGTSLSPATAIYGKYFKNGDPTISYGCGFAEVQDGLATAIMSEIFHQSGVATERFLGIIKFPNGISINIRAGKNLLRPAHCFRYLKEGNLLGLKRITDYYLDREVENKNLSKKLARDYEGLLKRVTSEFAKVAALFETKYIFCWFDWDGDNILMDGGILDYGSIRQFGKFHHRYRYDDVTRWSTNLTEQKNKARYITQTFAQMIDFLITGQKKSIKDFSQSSALQDFDQSFAYYRRYYTLEHLGLSTKDCEFFAKEREEEIDNLVKAVRYFEKKTDGKGMKKVPDGVNEEPLYDFKNFWLSLPKNYIQKNEAFDWSQFHQFLQGDSRVSHYSSPQAYEKEQMAVIHNTCCDIYNYLKKKNPRSWEKISHEISKRCTSINRRDRVTGDAIIYICQELSKKEPRMSFEDFNESIRAFINNHLLDAPSSNGHEDDSIQDKLQAIVLDYCEGL